MSTRFLEAQRFFDKTDADIVSALDARGLDGAAVWANAKKETHPHVPMYVAIFLAAYFGASLDWLLGHTDEPVEASDELKTLARLAADKIVEMRSASDTAAETPDWLS